MTKVTLHYNLARPLTEPELGNVANLPSTYGIARIQVAPGLDKIVVDYDASRLMKSDVESTLHRHGVPLAE
jgi:hypothetical protein